MSDNNQIIKEMYRGEESRDASSKIRGFLFQDLIAISKLLDNDTIYVIPEYVEDVLVYTEEKTYIIQAKYYPKGNINGKYNQIIRDLYYQYLRLKVKKYTEVVIPVLAVYSQETITKPSLSDLQGEEYINVDRMDSKNVDNVEEWLNKNVYSQNKEKAADMLFDTFASNKSMSDFLDMYDIQSDYKDIEQYREEVCDQLNRIQFDGCVIVGEDKKKAILLGLSIQYIQKRYNESMAGEDNFENRKCIRTEFIEYLKNMMCNETEYSIGAYLRSVVIECWERIQDTPLDENVSDMLGCICDNTAQWLYTLGSSIEGQKQLLNTVRMKHSKKLKDYGQKSVNERCMIIAEHSNWIIEFLEYLWKIMMDINCDILNNKTEFSEETRKKLMPDTYIDTNKENYISFKFPGDNSKNAVIFPRMPGGESDTYITNIFTRMQKFQPEKWYLKGCYKGEYIYSHAVSEIKPRTGYKVSTIDKGKFKVECMKCINVEKEGWNVTEDCKECIFNNNCKRSEEKE